jgi:hypothetical protein
VWQAGAAVNSVGLGANSIGLRIWEPKRLNV